MKIKINEADFRKLVGESIRRVLKEDEGSERLDKYGNPIPRNGQGWGVDDALQNRQGYNQDGSKGPWFSRSVAVATAVILNDNGKWYVLANQRGSGTPDYQGYWNLPCGYLDYNESAEQAASREVFEETGIRLNPSQIQYFGYSTNPNENRQNVCFFFVAFLNGNPSNFAFSKDNMEADEVEGIQWVSIDKCDDIMWAFDHDELINKILKKYSAKIKGDNNHYNGASGIIDRVIQGIKDNEDTEYLIGLLNRVKQDL